MSLTLCKKIDDGSDDDDDDSDDYEDDGRHRYIKLSMNIERSNDFLLHFPYHNFMTFMRSMFS